MRTIIPWYLLAFFIWSCSSSDPSVLSSSASDSNPVTGQKVLFQVWGLTDNPPLRYAWHADSGELEGWDEEQPYAYWIAPDSPATCSVTCTITDSEDNSSVQVFEVTVKPRELKTVFVDGTVSCLEKQRISLLGGAWVSTRDGQIRYVSSSTNEASSWTGVFGAMYIDLYGSSYALWGAPVSGNRISVQSSSGTAALVCQECASDGTIHDLAVDVLDTDLLWIASDSGLHWYHSKSGNHGTYVADAIGKAYDLFPGKRFVYVAADTGVFAIDGVRDDEDALLYPGDSCAVLEIIGDDATTQETEDSDTVTVWHITGGEVCRNGQALPDQPPGGETVCSLSIDLKGNIWCGKYRWDGESWQVQAGLEGVDVVKSAASNEGIIFFQTSSGALLRW